MSDAAYCRQQAEVFYRLAHHSDDAMERLAYILRAIEWEARAAELDGRNLPPAEIIDGKSGGDPETA